MANVTNVNVNADEVIKAMLFAAVLGGMCANGEYQVLDNKKLVVRAWSVVDAFYDLMESEEAEE